MTINQKNWNRLSFFEQMSNIDGEINRLTECKPEYRDFPGEIFGELLYCLSAD
jgi:hypothetical protein